ncbi:MAG: hypothetical protein AAGA68_07670 [Pseudomonadota bacterium]
MSETKAERFMTMHPQGKKGVNIEKAKYDGMRAALLRVIPKDDEGIPFGDLKALIEPHLDHEVFTAEVSRGWYVTSVKQDLEARGEIVQVPRSRPQRLRRP